MVPILLSADLPWRNKLQDLTLHENIPSVLNLLDLISLPRLRSLNISNIENFEISNSVLPCTYSGKRSELQRLDFGGSQIGPAALKEILLRCQASLKELICCVPVRLEWFEYFLQFRLRLNCNFSPIQITPILAPAAQTLTKLSLYTGRQDWPDHDRTRMDLGSFVTLKVLAESASYFITPLSHRLSRSGLYKLLPSSLEKLRVCSTNHLDFAMYIDYHVFQLAFGFDIGTFYSVNGSIIDQAGRDRFLDESMDSSSYGWIIELAEHKFDRLPSLRKVLFCEDKMERAPFFHQTSGSRHWMLTGLLMRQVLI